MNDADKDAIAHASRALYAANLFRTVAFVALGAGAFAIGTNMGILDSIAYGSLTLLVYGVVGKGIEAATIRRALDRPENNDDD
jgi:hypothetical protein